MGSARLFLPKTCYCRSALTTKPGEGICANDGKKLCLLVFHLLILQAVLFLKNICKLEIKGIKSSRFSMNFSICRVSKSVVIRAERYQPSFYRESLQCGFCGQLRKERDNQLSLFYLSDSLHFGCCLGESRLSCRN